MVLTLPGCGEMMPHHSSAASRDKVPPALNPTCSWGGESGRAAPQGVFPGSEFMGCSVSGSCEQNRAPSARRSRAVVLGTAAPRCIALCSEHPLPAPKALSQRFSPWEELEEG